MSAETGRLRPASGRFPVAAVVMSLSLSAAILMGSCTGSAPVITQVFRQENFRFDPELGRIYRELSLFLHVSDGDGIDDLDSVYLVSDAEELFFRIDRDEWVLREESGEIWIGSNRLVMPAGEGLPGGTYRVILLDRAGERTSWEIYIPQPTFPEPDASRFSRLNFEDGRASISGAAGERHILWFYNEAGETVKSFATRDPSFPLESAISSRELAAVREIYLYRLDSSTGMGMISGPFSPPVAD